MKIKRTIERVPGGMMLIPLLLGAIINTLFPNTATFFGSFTEAIFKGAAPLMAVNLFCIGVTMNFKATPTIVKKGGAILIAKVGIAALVGVVAAKFIGGGMIWGGLSVLAIIVAMNDTNGGMYISLMNQFGKKEDVGATTIMNLETGPFITMVTLGIAGLSTFPWQYMVGSILPLALGMVLGNLDSEIRDMFAKATPALIPFFAFGLGYGINLTKVYQAGLTGIFLGLAVIVITGTACFLADKLTGGSGLAGIASATTAGNAATVPALGGPDGLKPPNCPKKRPNWHSKGVLNERTISTAWPECDMFWKSEAFALCSRISTTTMGIRKSGNNSDRRICHTAALADNICST